MLLKNMTDFEQKIRLKLTDEKELHKIGMKWHASSKWKKFKLNFTSTERLSAALNGRAASDWCTGGY